MSAEAPAAVQNTPVNIPDIIITESSSASQNSSLTPVFIPEKPAPEDNIEDLSKTVEQTEKDPAPGGTISAPDEESGEFSPAEDCTECVVSVPEVAVSEQAEPSTGSSISDPDQFRTPGCCPLNVNCDGPYEYLWSILEGRYAILFWMLAMSIPVSAGVMGAIYMFECPAADSLPNMIFMIGISLMAVLTLRVCIIIHRLTWEDENSRPMLQTINLICLFITLLFFITETVTYWQMTSSIYPGMDGYCHPTFSSYLFWWNIATTVFLLLVLLFPIA